MMTPAHLLEDLVLILGTALVTVLVLDRLRLPAVAGFIVAGAFVGPSGLAWVGDTHEVERLADVGVVLLLFTIGLDLSLAELRRIGRLIVLGGGLQVGLTTLAVWGLARALGLPSPQGVFVGFLVALSSTAIVLRGLAERGETDAPHGRLILGVLLFQDLCVVPMMLVTPLLAGGGGGAWAIPKALAEAALVVAACLLLGRVVVPRAFALVARTRRRDLFVLAVVLACAGIAWLTSLVGLSLALGAFLAGIVLADTEFGHQALADVLPLRDIFTSLFFVTIGTLLDLRVVVSRPGLTLGLVAAVILGKAGVAALAGLAMRFPARAAIISALALAQVGEFSFVLARLGSELGLLGAEPMRLFLAASVLSMLVTPLALSVGPRLAAGAARLRGLERLLGIRDEPERAAAEGLSGHVLVLGYGVGGELLAEALHAARVPYAVLDMNAGRIRAARERGEPAWYGDVTSAEILERVGAARARQIAVMLNDPGATLRAVRLARRLAPEAAILARVRHVAEVPLLVAAGATQAVAQEFEASLELIGQVLKGAALPFHSIGARLEAARSRAAASGWSAAGGGSDAGLLGMDVTSAAVREGHWIAGRSLAESRLRTLSGATLVGLSRDGATAIHPAPDERFKPGDVLYLVGDEVQRAAAMALLEQGPATDAG